MMGPWFSREGSGMGGEGAFVRLRGVALAVSGLMFGFFAGAADLVSIEDWRKAWNEGRYEEMTGLTEREEVFCSPTEGWLTGEALIALGKRAELEKWAERMAKRMPETLIGPYLRYREALARGDTRLARTLAEEGCRVSDRQSWWGRRSLDLVMLGAMRLEAGADAKTVLNTYFLPALQKSAECEEAWEAIVRLALDRGDHDLASKKAREGLKKFSSNVRLKVMLGEALRNTDSRKATMLWMEALSVNPQMWDAIFLLGLGHLHSDTKDTARFWLDQIPEGHVYSRAMRLAFGVMEGRSGSELVSSAGGRRAAGTDWKRDFREATPWVLSKAGELVSGGYLFAEGAALQEAACGLDAEFLMAKRLRGEDLLKLGRVEEAWKLLEEVHAKDGYDVTVFNLLELRDRTKGHVERLSGDVLVRMSPLEMEVYGDRLLTFLGRARERLGVLYQWKPEVPTRVEVFDVRKDFAVRTFGAPRGEGYLAVCFGDVITAGGPRTADARGHSWQATLWHEYTHTVTLGLSRNRIPRWLSEGISVMEEQEMDPGWGHRYRPRHRSRLMHGQLYGFADIAEAFGSEEPTEMDFAYFQAGLMARWMAEAKGRAVLREVLTELGEGGAVKKVLEKRYGKFEEMDRAFFAYAKRWAAAQGGSLDWRDVAEAVTDEAARTDYFSVMARVRRAMGAKDWKAAEQELRRVVTEAPLVRDEEKGPWMLLARARRELGDTAGERQALEEALKLDHSMPTAWERLMELVESSGDEEERLRVSEGYLGVDPLNAGLLTKRVGWLEKTGRVTEAVGECARLKRLEPEREARWDSRMGVLLAGVDNVRARKHLLDALATNPRDRRALDTLDRMDRNASASGEQTTNGQKVPAAEPAKGGGGVR